MNRFDEMSMEMKARLDAHGKKATAVSHPFLTFRDGLFLLSDKDVTDSEWVALTDRATVGWFLFIDNKLVATRTVSILESDDPKRPNSHTDKTLWPLGSYNQRKDPWSRSWELPLMQRDGSRQIVVFKAGSEAARNAVGKLILDFSKVKRRPVIRLLTEAKQDGRLIPAFRIEGHVDDDEPLVDLVRDDTGDIAENKVRDDMDDDIPF
jgi:hypothetical protein